MWSERAACAVLLVLVAACAPERAENLVFVVLDTVRQDHLPTYGYPRDTAPRLDALAGSSAVFENAFAQQTNTSPSHASMFTGLYPPAHGSRFNGVRLAAGRVTLAQVLRNAGFSTAGFVSGVTMRAAASGLERGFEVYDDEFEGKRRDGRVATERAIRWWEQRRSGERAFLFLHLYDAHGPYLPTGSYAGLFRSAEKGPRLSRIPPYQVVHDPEGRALLDLNGYVDRYDAMIRYEDDLVARLLDEVDLDRTVVVILSDHGETLGERYRTLDHGGQAFDEQLRIPLVLSGPGIGARRVSSHVETVDLLPTLLELLEVPVPEGLPVQGRSLVPLLRGEEPEPPPFVFAQARSVADRHADRGYRLKPRTNISTVRGSRWKLILYPGVERDYVELYDLEADPGERTNVADARPEVRDLHLEALRDWLAVDGSAPSATPLSPELRRQLEELGYLD
jgi:arylsulfatase A-like enzyme